MGNDKVLAGVGVAGGLFVSFVGVSHLWPLVSPPPPYNSLLHIVTAWAMLPLGLLLAIRDAHYANMVSAGSVLGSRFDAALDMVSSRAHFVIFMVWAGLASASFGGLYGFLGFVLCLARAVTLLDSVREVVDQVLGRVKEELEKRNVHVPGFTDPAAAPPPEPKAE